MKLNLGVLFVDTKVVRIDEASYYLMHPNGDATGMDKIKKVWKETISTTWVSIVTDNKQCEKKQKQFGDICESTYGAFDNGAKKEESEANNKEREKEKKIEGKKKAVEVSDPISKPNKDTAAAEGEEEVVGCTECCEAPCMWVSEKEDMQDYDDINEHLPRAD
jgi:hypothetical protein